jgi:NADP-dependent 3-hydroxy acid dehydrogenase YdfG
MNSFEGQEANVYHGTKHAVKATTEILRQELIALKNDKIRVSVRSAQKILNF